MNIFTLPTDEYKRQSFSLNEYVEYCVLYTARKTKLPEDVCRKYIRKQMRKEGKHPIRDPNVVMLQRNKFGDRRQKETVFSEYLFFAQKNDLILVPTLTAYLNPNQRRSFNAEYIIGNMNKRKVYKKRMLECKLKEDDKGYGYNKIVQNGCKIKNNSVSGAHSSPSTPLYNKSSHSTLTSCCRISTSYANANNESLIRGNRHYHHPQIVFTELLSIARHYNLDVAQLVMDKYGLHYPSVDDVMSCITYSSRLYWQSEEIDKEIRDYVECMPPVERALFVYRGDLYHLAVYNEGFVKQFLGKLSTPINISLITPEGEAALKDGDIQTFAVLLCSDLMRGKKLEELKKENPESYGKVVATALHVQQTVIQYGDFIQAFWRTPVLPASIAKLPNIIRRAVLTSDTDSSIFTAQYWVKWYVGEQNDLFSKKAYEIGYCITYLASQTVRHRLALMSANLGFVPEHRNIISMKNEYYIPVYSLTYVAKHYYGYKSAQEGYILKKLDPEVKGVHLRNSSAPPEVTAKLADFMYLIMDTVMAGKKLTMDQVLGTVAELELAMFDDIAVGGFRYMKSIQVKNHTGYSEGKDNHTYKQYLFWNEVFGPVYGYAPAPPYEAVKAPIEMDNATKFKRWAANAEDPGIRERLMTWAQANGKYEKNNIYVPLAVASRIGLPPEIRTSIAARRLVRDIVSPFYTVLESLGLFYLDDSATRLVSDEYVPLSRRQPLKLIEA